MNRSDRRDMTRDRLTLTAKTRRGKKNKQNTEGRVFVGPIEIGDANTSPSEQAAVRDYVRYTGNCPVESESELISKSNQST
jgi:hypothetical protein